MASRDVGLIVVAGGIGRVVLVRTAAGDIRYESGNARVYIPITSMLLVSIVISLLAWLPRTLA